VTRLRALWGRVEPQVGTRAATAVVGGAALVTHTLVTLVFPVVEGRDYVTYLRVYAEMWSWTSVIPWEMLWRMPVAPALLGVPLDLGGAWTARIAIALAFAATVVLWFRVALRFGPATAAALAGLLVVAPSFLVLFHRYSSDAVTGLVLALLALALARAWERPTAGRCAVVGAAIVLAALTRPAHQSLVLLALFPLLLGGTWRVRLGRAGIVALVAMLPLLAWTGFNGARYDDRALSRGGGAWLPFYRAYLTDRIVAPDAGPASRELAALVRRELLTRRPYTDYGIDETRFWGEPTTRYHEDLVGLTDRALGWDARNELMRRAALEAIRAEPAAFASGVARSFVRQLTEAVVQQPPGAGRDDDGGTVTVDGDELPAPSEGGSIPAASFSYWLSRPDNAFDEVWTSATEHHVVSDDPALLERLAAMEERVASLRLEPTHDGSPTIMRWLNRAAILYPPALLWLVVGVVGIVLRRPARWPLAALVAVAALAILGATLLSVPPVPEFGAPLYPAFALLGLVGLLGRRPGAGTQTGHG
jgi:hypothetical protein